MNFWTLFDLYIPVFISTLLQAFNYSCVIIYMKRCSFFGACDSLSGSYTGTGSLIKHQVVIDISLGIALHVVLDALRKSVDSKVCKDLDDFL